MVVGLATCSGRKVATMIVILISTTKTWNQPHQNTKNLIWMMANTPDCLLSFSHSPRSLAKFSL